jgi:hypothetical protein
MNASEAYQLLLYPKGIFFGFAQDKFSPVVPHAMLDFRHAQVKMSRTLAFYPAKKKPPDLLTTI